MSGAAARIRRASSSPAHGARPDGHAGRRAAHAVPRGRSGPCRRGRRAGARTRVVPGPRPVAPARGRRRPRAPAPPRAAQPPRDRHEVAEHRAGGRLAAGARPVEGHVAEPDGRAPRPGSGPRSSGRAASPAGPPSGPRRLAGQPPSARSEMASSRIVRLERRRAGQLVGGDAGDPGPADPAQGPRPIRHGPRIEPGVEREPGEDHELVDGVAPSTSPLGSASA